MANDEIRKITTKNFQRDGNKATVEVTITDEYLNESVTHDVHTNEGGTGLWIDGKQVTGTSQFGVPASDSGARSAIVRFFKWLG